jgi:hypothetical protein
MMSLEKIKKRPPFRNGSIRTMVMVTMIAAILTLAASNISYPHNQVKLAVAQEEEQSASTLPQPDNNSTVLNVEATNALFQPAVGLTNVFGPEGLFPFTDVFTCSNALTCGVPAGETEGDNQGVEATFTGTFEEGNRNNLTSFEATYTSPVTYGPHQIEGHTYQMTLTDTMWNTPDSALPTRIPEFAANVNNVGFDQIQHGASHVDRSDVPQLSNLAFLYGHARITDITDGNDTVVADDIFTHVMVGHVMDEKTFYRDLRDEAATPNLVFVFGVNIPNGVELPGVGQLSAEQAQSFTPVSADPSLSSPPQFDYPVSVPNPRNGTIAEPQSQSTTWPVANPEQPLYFSFLLYQDADISYAGVDGGEEDEVEDDEE